MEFGSCLGNQREKIGTSVWEAYTESLAEYDCYYTMKKMHIKSTLK